MKFYIFAVKPPHGRCLLLAQKLNEATSMPPTQCVALAESLFAFLHKQGNPAVVEVSEPRMVEKLQALCDEFGISMESVSNSAS